jgi:hypothetical protein
LHVGKRRARWVCFKNDFEVQIRRDKESLDEELYLVAEMGAADEGATCAYN